MEHVSWDEMVNLNRLDGDPTQQPFLRGGLVAQGSLASMIKQVMRQPHTERWRYSIMTDHEMIDAPMIEVLADRHGFPG